MLESQKQKKQSEIMVFILKYLNNIIVYYYVKKIKSTKRIGKISK
jgi:hypothetical protein